MHIKKMVLTDFKSYKGTVVLDNLQCNANAVVGQNGSGKSNFFEGTRSQHHF